MPRRKIGADLKEALCKLYEAGDISADTIEKHGIMSRATFFRNLKMYKSGASLEQRHSTGRKTNADKLKEHEKLELDALRPEHLSQLELVLLLDEHDKGLQDGSGRNKRKAKTTATSSKRRELVKSLSEEASRNEGPSTREGSDSESEGDSDDAASLAKQQALVKLTQHARSFLASDDVAGSSRLTGSSGPDANSGVVDLDSLLKPEDSHYSHVNRGALYIVRIRVEAREHGAAGEIIAAIALRSLIWTPEIYQTLGSSYASRSIDRICNLAHLRVDPRWQRRGVGRWLVSVAGLKAAKLGFSHLYTQCEADRTELLSFWQHAGFSEFARFDNIARLEQAAAVFPASAHAQSHVAKLTRRASANATASAASHIPPRRTIAYANDHGATSEASPPKQTPGGTDLQERQDHASVSEIHPAIPLDPSISSNSVDATSMPGAAKADMIVSHAAAGSLMLPTEPTGHSAESAHQSTDRPFPMVEASSKTTTNEPSRSAMGPPPRRIAFHEAADVETGSQS